jgi:N-carbamoyl-L-amino-acid hydrolase
MPVNAIRLLSDLRELAGFGRFGTGVDRVAYSQPDIAARIWLANRLDEAGLDPVIDDVGNVYGKARNVGHAVLIGSHTDTVPKGGWLDGSLGVIYGLEIARCNAEQGHGGRCGVDVVSFQDEEGTYSALFGSRTFCGDDVSRERAEARSQGGTRLADAIDAAGLAGNPQARLDVGRHLAYFEAHIEQGPRLEAAGESIGVVTGIVGIRSFRIVFEGRADHAGTTPMAMRKDAGAAAIAFTSRITEGFRTASGSDTVWNLGGCTLSPGAVNVVPAEAALDFQFRDDSTERLDRMEAMLREIAAAAADESRTSVVVTRVLATEPTAMDPDLGRLIADAAGELGVAHRTMPSGAGHDALVAARYIPSAMLFVPSIGGRSHHVSENTADSDIVTGANVLLAAVEKRIAALG